MKIVKISIPEYDTSKELDLRTISKRIDKALVDNFSGSKVILRAVSSQAHDMSQVELIEAIKKLGFDRYDPIRKGDRYDNIEGKQIDVFGRICSIKEGNLMSKSLVDGFHVYGAKFHGKPSGKMDIWLLYDRTKMTAVSFHPTGYKDLKRDGYIFKDQNNKPDALLGIIVIQ